METGSVTAADYLRAADPSAVIPPSGGPGLRRLRLEAVGVRSARCWEMLYRIGPARRAALDRELFATIQTLLGDVDWLLAGVRE